MLTVFAGSLKRCLAWHDGLSNHDVYGKASVHFIQFIIDFILHIDIHLNQLMAEYGIWVYVILFAIIFCETGLVVTPFLPGDSMLFVGGALAALPSNPLNVHLFALLMILAAVLGDAVNFLIGRFFGEKLFANPNSRIFRRSYLDKTHAFFEHHGGKAIIIARFIPIVRTLAPFVGGMGNMPYRQFALYNILGAIAWIVLFTYAGYFFYNLPFVSNNLHTLVIVVILLSLLPPVIEVIRNKMQQRRRQ